MAYHLDRDFLQHCNLLLGERDDGRNHDTFAGVDAERVDIFHWHNGETVVVFVADYLKLNLFPAFERLLYENLLRVGKSAFAEFLERFFVGTDA